MTGQAIINDAEGERREWNYQEPQATRITLDEHAKLLELHSRALACHCECLGMNAENSHACCVGNAIPYGDDSYIQVMRKWNLLNDKGEPTI